MCYYTGQLATIPVYLVSPAFFVRLLAALRLVWHTQIFDRSVQWHQTSASLSYLTMTGGSLRGMKIKGDWVKLKVLGWYREVAWLRNSAYHYRQTRLYSSCYPWYFLHNGLWPSMFITQRHRKMFCLEGLSSHKDWEGVGGGKYRSVNVKQNDGCAVENNWSTSLPEFFERCIVYSSRT